MKNLRPFDSFCSQNLQMSKIFRNFVAELMCVHKYARVQV